MSYGIILYTFDSNGDFKVLLYQRRDNFDYMDFMRGYWSGKDDVYRLFSLMSQEERERIQNYTFDELWDDLWVNHDYRIYKDGYKSAKRKYDYAKPYIKHVLETTETRLYEPPWGFAKGKKNNNKEGDIECAIREFREETKLEVKIDVIPDVKFSEKFVGTNGKIYSTDYYVAYTAEMVTPAHTKTPSCIREYTISEEANDVKWVSFDDGLKNVNSIRQEILTKVYNLIQRKV